MKKEYDFLQRQTRSGDSPGRENAHYHLSRRYGFLKRFKAESERTGKGYQTLINDTLKSYLGLSDKPLTAEIVLAKIVREELSSQS